MHGNWIRQTTTTTGTGNLTLAAVTGYATVAQEIGVGSRFSYSVYDTPADPVPIEYGIAYLTSSTTMVREKVRGTMVGGTLDNTSPTAVTLASGTKYVVAAPLAETIMPAMPCIGTASGLSSTRLVGNAMCCQPLNSPSYTSLDSGATGRFNICPFLLPYGGEYDAMGVMVGTAEAGRTLRIGLYAFKANGDPGELVVQCSAIDVSSTGYRFGTFAAQKIPAGWYLVALQSDATSALVLRSSFNTGIEAVAMPTPWGSDGNGYGLTGYAVSGLTLSTMPATVPSLGGVTGGIRIPNVLLRAVS